ncbi:MAG: heparinase II/III family protein, partial [Oscillospiraceae bacterium]|nr:heparinase II/III family protein [Oscillospiraceae bacterium]
MEGRRTLKRALSLLLVLVMLLGVLPGGLFPVTEVSAAKAEEEEAVSYEIDFKEFAKTASQQDWWANLPAGKDANTVLVGCEGSNDPMTADEKAAFADMQAYLAENEIWNIDDTVSGLTNQYWNKRLYFNTSDDVEWGMLFFPIYHANMPERAKLGLTVTIPEGGAGIYRFDAEVFLEDTNSTSRDQTGLPPAGGHANIYVNDELVAEEYSFNSTATHKNTLYNESFGSVYLTEGVNTIVIYSTGDTNKTTAGGRSNYGFGSMTFTMTEKVNSLKMDFKAFAKKAAQQDWWSELRAAPNANTMFIGSTGSAASYEMTAEQKAAYDEMRAYLAENEIWNIDETLSGFKGYTYFKRLYFCADPTVPWGICYYPYYHNTGIRPERSKLAFTLNVPAGSAGWYAMDLSVFMENTAFASTTITGTSSGGAYIDVFVNGNQMYDDFSTVGGNVLNTKGLGAVYLEEGENSVVIESALSYNNTGAGGRCNIDLNYIEFFALEAEEVEAGQSSMLDLRTSYLAFDAVVTDTFAVEVKDEDIATASFNSDGNLIITGLLEGETELYVTDGDLEICTIPVLVTPKSSLTFDFSKASEKTAEGFDAIASYEDLDVDDGVITDPWHFEALGADTSACYDAAQNAAVLTGASVQFVLDVAEDMWYLPSFGYYAQNLGDNAEVYLSAAEGDPMYLGTVYTYAENKTFKTADLRPVQLEAGEYVLTLTNEGTALWWGNFRLKNAEEPELELTAESDLSAKEGREMKTQLSATWNGELSDDMFGAEWYVTTSDDSVEGWVDEDGVLTVVGTAAGEYEAEVMVTISGIAATVTVPVTVIEPAKPVSMEVEIFGVNSVVARNTVQKLDYTIMGSDGEEIFPNEMNITYTAEPEGMVEFDAENHTFTTLQNGDVTIDIVAERVGVELTKTFELTIEDRGENLYDVQSGDFEAVEEWNKDNWHWDYGTTYEKPADISSKFAYGEVIEEADGNHALKLTFNPDVSYTNVKGGSELRTDGGNFVKLMPGHLYEFTFRAKVEDLQVPVGSTATFQLLYQNYDYPVNAFQSSVVNDFYTSCNIAQTSADWVEYTVPVRAPITHDGPIYVMHRLVLRPSSSAYYDLTGWSGSVYLDDFEVREVGLDHVDVYLESPLTDTEHPANLMIEPYATSGSLLVMDAAELANTVQVATTNEDVIDIKGELTTVKNADGVAVPAVSVGLVGLNAEAAMNVDVNIHGVVKSASLDATQTNMANVIRDMDYRLNAVEALTVKRGEIAEGIITARTTQLDPLTEESIRANGAVYFVSEDTTIATVDQSTGDVTAVGEGETVIHAYVLVDGITRSDSARIVVSDDTDLVSIDLTAQRDYLTVGSSAQLYVSGTKASGGRADMTKFAVAYSLEQDVIDNGIATITETGYLTAYKPGIVTVTATAGVQRSAITDTFTIEIVEDTLLPHGNVSFEFTYGKVVRLETATLEKDGIQISEDNTANISYHAKHGISCNMNAGAKLVLDLHVPRSGWYTVENWGAAFSYGCNTEIYMDDAYVGYMSYIGTSSYDNNSIMNTLWLDAGVHTITIEWVKNGTIALGSIILRATEDPNEMEMTLSAKPELLTGESTELSIDIATANNYGNYTLKTVTEQPDYTNYCVITSSDPSVIEVSGRTLTAKKAGNATIIVTAEIAGKQVEKAIELSVMDGVIGSIDAEAAEHTLLPDAEGTTISVTAFAADGTKLEAIPEDVKVTYTSLYPGIASVDQNGNVTLTGKEGSAEIEVNVNENGRDMTVSVWITVTTGKTKPTLYTYEERTNAQENALKYSWAWDMKEAAVADADYIVENLDTFYDLYVPFFTEARAGVGTRTDPDRHTCRYCHADLTKYPGGVYSWIIDPINNPWKLTCPACKRDFPSNDFGAYYESGLDEQGKFSYDLANKELLTNDLYPEMGEGWGVDDGQGYISGYIYPNGAKEVHNYIQYYIHAMFYTMGNSKYAFNDVITDLRDAYLYTGDEKYGNAGAILIDRMADLYPYYKYLYDWDKGWIIGCIWEANTLQPAICTGADAFWPCQTNDEVINYIKGKAHLKGLQPEDITPQYLRDNVDENLMMIIKQTCETGQSSGNFGMHQAAMAYAAVCLDRLPESAEMIDWIFRSPETVMEPNGKYEITVTGADLMSRIVERVDRDGFGDEGSDAYNRMWYQNLLEAANALQGYDRVEGANLWENAKFVTMFDCYADVLSMGTTSFQTGENGSIQMYQLYLEVDALLKAFVETGDPDIAKALYYANGNSVDGLHADIFTADPESGIRNRIQQIVDNEGELNWNESEMLGGRGIAMLRNGPEKLVKGTNEAQFSDYAILFTPSAASGHGAAESLSLQLSAYGLILTPHPGYPNNVNEQDPQREQWVRNTVSHNTVVVDDRSQDRASENQFPLHFDDAGRVKMMDVSASVVYAQTDIYRRTLVTVDKGDDAYYAVDFFRVLGGSEHVYSFHGATMLQPETEGLDLVHQPMGTYESPDKELGPADWNPHTTDAAANRGSGYNWLYDVYRDAQPENNYSVDFMCQDFRNTLIDASGIHLKLTMLSEEPMSEVAIANGYSIQKTGNPEYMKFVLARRSGENGLDSLFTSVIEPYRYDSSIASSELVDVVLAEGTETKLDKAAAIKVTLTSGRVDYVVYATNPDCLYSIVDNGEEIFKFKGFTGVASYEGGKLTYAYGNDTTDLIDAKLGTGLKDEQPAVTGELLAFTEGLSLNGYTMTISMDQPVSAEELTGRYIYVNNDGIENAVYRIWGADVDGFTAKLDLDMQTMARSYIDATDLEAGFIHNVAVGQSYTIPLSTAFDVAAMINYIPDQVVKAGYQTVQQVGVEGSGLTYEIDTTLKGAKWNANTGKLTWTPNKTQVGRYPVVVSALNENGDVVATTEFTLYVVSYTGASYDPTVCKHVKALTYTVGDVVETVCPACGLITKTGPEYAPEDEPSEPIELIDIAGTNMNLGNELALNFMFPKALDESKSYTAIITQTSQGKEVKTTEIPSADWASFSNTLYKVTASVRAMEMADELAIKIVDEEGNVYNNAYSTSVRAYGMKAL